MKYKVPILITFTLLLIVAAALSTFNSRQAPVVAKPTPTAANPTPTAVKPTKSSNPAPTDVKPTPTAAKPTPTAAKPTPIVTKPTPVVTKPEAKGTYPIMQGSEVPMNKTNTPYTAGKDIPAGLYHSTNSICGYQIRLADKTLINVSTYEKGSTLVEIRAGEQLLNTECSIVFGPPVMQDILLPGDHLVGVDIEPGIYHAENNLSCRFALASKAVLTRGDETIKAVSYTHLTLPTKA